jgi:excisionase family DNA binding protein
MTVQDLAKYLGFSKNWIYRKAEAGEIPATRFGNRWRFKKSVIDRWLEKSVLKGAKPFVRGRPTRAKTELEGRLVEGLRTIHPGQPGRGDLGRLRR